MVAGGFCESTFDNKHHYAPRQWGALETGNRRTVLACVCTKVCPPKEVAAVQAALDATEFEIESQRRRPPKVRTPELGPRLL